MSNQDTIVRGTARTFRATISGAAGTETLKLVVGKTAGVVGALVKALSYSAGTFYCVLTAAETAALEVGTYIACVWRTDSTQEDVPVRSGVFIVIDQPKTA